jgi:hypothetical protein
VNHMCSCRPMCCRSTAAVSRMQSFNNITALHAGFALANGAQLSPRLSEGLSPRFSGPLSEALTVDSRPEQHAAGLHPGSAGGDSRTAPDAAGYAAAAQQIAQSHLDIQRSGVGGGGGGRFHGAAECLAGPAATVAGGRLLPHSPRKVQRSRLLEHSTLTFHNVGTSDLLARPVVVTPVYADMLCNTPDMLVTGCCAHSDKSCMCPYRGRQRSSRT